MFELAVGPEHFFRVSQVRRRGGQSRWSGLVEARCGTLGLHGYELLFDGLERFRDQLGQMYARLAGSARWGRSTSLSTSR